MNVFIIGAGGKIGTRLSRQLSERGHEVTGMHRRAEQAATVAGAGAKPLQADLIASTVRELSELVAGHDAVVFTAGAHGTGIQQDDLIDGKGLEKSADAALLAGVRRFVLVSGFPDAERGRFVSETFEHHMAVKRNSDVYLAATDLDWTIVRAGKLTEDSGTGQVAAGPAQPYRTISREDVAAVIVAALETTPVRRSMFEVITGDTPIPQAVAALVSGAV